MFPVPPIPVLKWRGRPAAARCGGPASAAVTGTITSSTDEDDIVSGGQTIVLTLTNDTWVASGATFDAQRQNIIDGLLAARREP